jgi:hypothetical protein
VNRLEITATGIWPAGQPCRGCSSPLEIAAPEAALPGERLLRCAVCGDDKLYTQKDFDQRLGCLILVVGAALVPWTYGLSMGVCALADLLLYRALPPVTVCYVCKSRYRGLPLNPDHAPFELVTAQTWEARSVNWRSIHDRTRN